MFSTKLVALGVLYCVNISVWAHDCIDGNPWPHTSALVGAGFSFFSPTLDTPEGWGWYEFSDRIVPIPTGRVSRVVLIGDLESTKYVYFQSETGPVVWYADLTGALGVHEETGIRLEELLENAIVGTALSIRSSEEEECIKAVVSLIVIDLVSDETSVQAFRNNSDYFLQGRNSDSAASNWEAFWRNSDGSLTNARWRLSNSEVNLLASIDEDGQIEPDTGEFAELMECIQKSGPDSCEEIEIEGILIVPNPGFLK